MSTHQHYFSFFLEGGDCSGNQKDVSLQLQLLQWAIKEVGPKKVVQGNYRCNNYLSISKVITSMKIQV
jgi:hypothetical protein